EDGVVRDYIDIDAGFVVVPILVAKRRLRSVLAHDAILVLAQFRFEDRIARNRFEVVVISSFLFLRLSAAVMEKSGHHRNGSREAKPQREMRRALRWMVDTMHEISLDGNWMEQLSILTSPSPSIINAFSINSRPTR